MAGLFDPGAVMRVARAGQPTVGAVFADPGNSPTYEGGYDSAHYTGLSQIDRTNVHRLTPAWTHPSGGSYASPLVIDGTMYLLGDGGRLEALDAATGRVLWAGPNANPQSRGLSYWQSADGRERRVFYTVGNDLRAVDAATGIPITTFGEGGSVDLRQGLERDPAELMFTIAPYTPGRVYKDMIILGSFTGEDYQSPPGDIRAFNVRTGKLVWQFHTIPAPGEVGYDTWDPPEPRKRHGGVNAWGSNFTIDTRRGIVFFGTGSSTYDYWGGDRKGDNLFADSLVALDVATGKYLWHFQTVHHDLWDMDIGASPVLVTVKKNGRRIDAVVIATKTGFVFAFERATGKPLWPIEERPVPQDALAGESPSPTQPFPAKLPPFVPQHGSVQDILDHLDPDMPAADRHRVAARVSAARFKGTFTPLSDTQETILYPGTYGGANWSALFGDPGRGRIFVVGRNIPSIMRLAKGSADMVESWLAQDKPPYQVGRAVYADSCASCHGADRAGQPPAIPSLVGIIDRRDAATIAALVHKGRMPMPPFPRIEGEIMNGLLAYLVQNEGARPGEYYTAPTRKGAELWRTQFGAMDDLDGNSVMKAPKSSLYAYDLNRGTMMWSVPINDTLTASTTLATRTGLIFLGSTRGRTVRAFDADTGRTLWTFDLPMGAYGVPSSYAVKGRQYIVVPTSTGYGKGPAPASWNAVVPEGLLSTPVHGATAATQNARYVVFALPESQ